MSLKLARIAGLILLLIVQPAMSNDNPLFQNLPLLNYQAITASDFEPAMDTVLQQFDTRLASIVISPPSWNNSVVPLQEATNAVVRIWNVISHLNAVNGTPEIKTTYQKILPKVTGFYSKIVYNRDLYKAYKAIATGAEFTKLNTEQQAHINNMLRDFRLTGAELDPESGNRLKQINTSIQELGHKFAENLSAATNAWSYQIPVDKANILDGVPDTFRNAAAAKAKTLNKTGWVLNLDDSSVATILSYAKDRELRQTFYKAYNTLASDQAENSNDRKWDNASIINQILTLRQEVATILGYKSYADYALATKGSQTIDDVLKFLNDLTTQAKPKAQQELQLISEYAKNVDRIDKLEAWDLAYYSQKYKEKKFDIRTAEFKKFFPKNTVYQGLFTLTNLLFNLEFKEEKSASTWNNAVQVFSVTDQNKQLRGYFYLDIFARDQKTPGTWTGFYTSRFKFSDGAIQLPVAFINASFSGGSDGLLEYHDVESLFFEFGHMLEHVLTMSDYPNLSGLNANTFESSKVISNFMADWFWIYDVMLDISQNVNNGQDLPRDDFNKMYALRNYNAALALLGQIELALFDFGLHSNSAQDLSKTPLAILTEIRQSTAITPHYEYERLANHFLYSFSTEYAANYYVEQWSQVLAADIFASFRERSLFDPQIGKKFLKTFLEKTGEESTLDLFINFKGRAPSTMPYLTQAGILSN
jgi:oligopeptidase A